MVTGMNRLTAAVNGLRSDRIPVFCNLLDQGAPELGISLQDYYSKGEHVAEAQLKMREKYGYDNLWSLFYVGKEAELLGCDKIIYTSDGSPNVADWVIKGPDDIHKLQVPEDISAHPAFKEVLTCLRILKKEAADKYPICAYVTASMTLPTILMGIGNWMELLLNGPVQLRNELLEKCSLFFRREVEAYRDAGASILLYSNPFGSTDIIPRHILDTVSMEWMKKDLMPGGTNGVVYYCGGARMNDVIKQIIESLGITAFYLSPFDNIIEGKRITADRALCAGVINDIKLIDWSEKEIKAEVKRILSEGMPGGRFLFGTLVMPYAIPEKNIRTLVEAAYEFGSY